MAQRILDTCILISCWRRKDLPRKTPKEVQKAARELCKLYGTQAVVTPVCLELLSGAASKREADLTKEFLREFIVVDQGRISPKDWEDALRMASQIPRDGKRRNACNCLIRAVADRLNYDVETTDAGFPS